MRQRVVLDVARDVAELLELRQRGDGGGAACDEAGAGTGERPLQPHVGQRAMGVLLEGGEVATCMGCCRSDSVATSRP
jgi:hypothetical protein